MEVLYLLYMPPQMKLHLVPQTEPVEVKQSEEKVLRTLPEGYEYIPGGNGAYRLKQKVGDGFAAMSANDEKYLVDLDEFGRKKLPEGYRYIGESRAYELVTDVEKAPAGVKSKGEK